MRFSLVSVNECMNQTIFIKCTKNCVFYSIILLCIKVTYEMKMYKFTEINSSYVKKVSLRKPVSTASTNYCKHILFE